ncbi:hypothetical protein HS088_TW13G00163 [Tripterygium wilfordii]|uniref:MACPF domain-containing protein n=1 Tax=Tripterygium wilfordii TaxID=458696 RepID=A0A7J7CTC2_TRIWF|nr:hypothetical protein HS088_TW13G00163 [Tripterygium wilfordii]
MSCRDRNRGGGNSEFEQPVLRRSVEEEPRPLTQNGSARDPQLIIDESLLVDPKLLFIGSKIGEGAHGKVYEGRYGDRIVAIKVLDRGRTSDERAALENRFTREVIMMSRVKHENLVTFIGACKEPLMVIVTELLPGLSLRKYLTSIRPKQLDLHVVLSFALDIARATDFLHANGIIHRDLKPDNLLLTANQKAVKLADFGLAREESVTEMMTAETGTYRWMAPELYSTVTLRQGEKKHYNNKVDVYSFGIVLWELLTNRMPFEGMSNLQAAYAAAFKALGRGFDVNSDTRLLYCKGIAGSRIVEVDEEQTRDLFLYDDLVLCDVSRDIKNSVESIGRRSSGVCTFNEMVEYFNQIANISGGFPLGSFNSAFSFTGSKHIDAAAVKALSVDGFYIPLAKVELKRSLLLQENVKRAVPTSWDPPSLATFIEYFGTHVITSVTIGGKDMIYVKQHQSSPLSTVEMKNYVQEIGNQRFSDTGSPSCQTKFKDKGADSGLFNSQEIYPQPTNAPYSTGKEDVTVIFRRRGGDDLEQSHHQWARTVRSSPDVIEMTFIPITSLLDGLPGKEHLTRAISLYLEFKPRIEELRYFLEFQVPRVWAPVQDKIPGQQRKEPVCPSLHFSMMGQKLFVSQEQVHNLLPHNTF